MMKKVIDNGYDSQKCIYISYLWILPQRKLSAYKNISLLDRLAYCEAALFAAKQCDKMLQ